MKLHWYWPPPGKGLLGGKFRLRNQTRYFTITDTKLGFSVLRAEPGVEDADLSDEEYSRLQASLMDVAAIKYQEWKETDERTLQDTALR